MSMPDPNKALAVALAVYAIDSTTALLQKVEEHNAKAPPARHLDPEPWLVMRGEIRRLLQQIRDDTLTADQIRERLERFTAEVEQRKQEGEAEK